MFTTDARKVFYTKNENLINHFFFKQKDMELTVVRYWNCNKCALADEYKFNIADCDRTNWWLRSRLIECNERRGLRL